MAFSSSAGDALPSRAGSAPVVSSSSRGGSSIPPQDPASLGASPSLEPSDPASSSQGGGAGEEGTKRVEVARGALWLLVRLVAAVAIASVVVVIDVVSVSVIVVVVVARLRLVLLVRLVLLDSQSRNHTPMENIQRCVPVDEWLSLLTLPIARHGFIVRVVVPGKLGGG
ncbi:hypothetical protein UVI_02010560 [Ustilaginoidea virens]|uniref:Uncharacterized protein n=1 Tax=Ustilaginoidea virens TaxID=1159556 RepID=A0A1B5KWR3_USTVR|nr:hypothetical protein UVI_02010560 [Ustilaginoidea virens]